MHLQGAFIVEHRAMLCYPLSHVYPLEALDNVCEVRPEHTYFMRVDAINGS